MGKICDNPAKNIVDLKTPGFSVQMGKHPFPDRYLNSHSVLFRGRGMTCSAK